MTDKKYETGNDRQKTTLDFKQRIIDLMANAQPLPDVGIYDEPVRYFKANEQWCAVIFGWLAWLEDIAGWQDAEDENYQGIQAILTFEEGIDPLMSIDYEAWYDANKRAIYDAVNDIAKQIVSGRTFNIAVGDDGTVTDPTTSGGAELPEDDPTTEIDETEAARFGGILEIASNLELLIDRMDSYYGNTNGTPIKTLAEAQSKIRAYFQSNEALMNAAIADYYTYRTSQAILNWNRPVTFEWFLYCNGYDNASLARWLIDKSGFTDEKQKVFQDLWFALDPDFYSYYFGIGSKVPSNAYVEADCIPVVPQSFENVPFGSQRTTSTMKAYHRLKIKISGVSNDNDGDLQDAFYFVNGSTGVRTRTNPTFNHFVTNIAPDITDNQIVYNNAHIYEFTVDLSNATNSPLVITMNKNAAMSGAATNPNFLIEIVDLGQGAES